MASNVIPFPVRTVTGSVPSHDPDIREARAIITKLRAEQAACDKYSRAWQVVQIKLDWWLGHLAELAGTANDNVVELRRA